MSGERFYWNLQTSLIRLRGAAKRPWLVSFGERPTHELLPFARPARSDVEALLRTVLAKEVTDCRSPLPVVSDLTLANVDY